MGKQLGSKPQTQGQAVTPRQANAPVSVRSRGSLSQQPLMGNHTALHHLASPRLQAKLTVNQPGDLYEQEADRLAEQLMNIAEPTVGTVAESVNRGSSAKLQRKCACGSEGMSSECAECQQKQKALVQRRATSGSGPVTVPPIVSKVIQAPGQPLDTTARVLMESRVGYDFSQVRVHFDHQAMESARAINANAYTLGKDVIFGPGQFAPQTAKGNTLLAHELVHVVQQDQGSNKRVQRQVADSNASQDTLLFDQIIEDGKDISSQITFENLKEVGQGAIGGLQELYTRITEQLIAGWYVDKGQFTIRDGVFQFTRPELQLVLNYLKVNWALSVPSAPQQRGDTGAKAVSEYPEWVNDFQEKLINQPAANKSSNEITAWDQESLIAQRLIEAYLRAWTKGNNNAGHVNSNIEELYSRIGASVTNQQAFILGGFPGGGDWCDPATVHAIVLGLMKSSLRFKTGKAPVTPDNMNDPSSTADALVQELRNQSIFFHQHWYNGTLPNGGGYSAAVSNPNGGSPRKAKDSHPDPAKPKDQERQVQGEAAWTAPLRPGDFITVINGAAGPLSGHVATVIKEEFEPEFAYLQFAKGEDPEPERLLKKKIKAGDVISTIKYVSGNAKGGAVRAEEVKREVPPNNYNYFNIALPANYYDRNKTAYHRGESAWDKTGLQPKVERALGKLLHEAFDKQLPIDNLDWIPLANGNFEGTPYADLPSYGEAYRVAKEALPKWKAMAHPHNVMQWLLDRKLLKPVSRTDDPKFLPGRHAPSTPNHSWVVVIVRASLLDAKSLVQSATQFDFTTGWTWDQSQLDKLALEPLGSTIDSLYPGAMEFLATPKSKKPTAGG